MPDQLYLVDGMAIAYRSYFAFVNAPLVNSRGEALEMVGAGMTTGTDQENAWTAVRLPIARFRP